MIQSLLTSNGSWQSLEENWQGQCDQIGEPFDEYAPDSMGVLRDIADGGGTNNALSKTGVAGMYDEADGHFYAACMLNLAQVPGVAGMTLRVRHVLVSPLLDFGEVDPKVYANVLIGMVAGVLHLSESLFQANNVRFHLRSPADTAFFQAFGKALDGQKVFESVQMRGAWLYIQKA